MRLLLSLVATTALTAQEPQGQVSKPGDAVPAPEQQPAAPVEWVGGAPFWEWAHLTGNWGGGRDWLEQHGIEVAGGYTADWSAPWSGGLSRRSTVATLLDVNVAFDLDQLLGLPRTSAYVDAYAAEGRDPSTAVGDLQGVSNIQGQDTEQISELWLETWIADTFRLKVGKVDYNSEFAFTETGKEFINSTAAISPTILGAPTYPNPAMSVNVFCVPSDRCYLGVGVYDGAGHDGFATGRLGPSNFFRNDATNDYLIAAEAGTSWPGGDSWGSGRFAIGGWHHTGDFATFAGGTDHGAHGFYAVGEQRLWREHPADADDQQGLGMFAYLAFADDQVAAIATTVTVGLAWTGALPGRDDDVLGFAVLHADLSDAPAAGFARDETALELLYKVQVTPAIALKPDLQYILSPGGDPTRDNVLVATLRFELTF